MKNLEWNRNEYLISTNPEMLQPKVILDYMQNQSYWAKTRTAKQMSTAIKNSLCFGLFHRKKQVGFARVVTDYAVFAYLADVYILPDRQGASLGKWLMQVILSHPELQNITRWILATRDAHRLYEKYGFQRLNHAERWMEKPAPDAF